jgi:hypothetical protein
MPDGDLRHLAEVEETSIGFTRPDGSTGSAPVGRAGGRRDLGAVDPRPARRLVPAAGANPDGEVGDRATSPRARPPVEDVGTVEAVIGAYAAKDGDSP